MSSVTGVMGENPSAGAGLVIGKCSLSLRFLFCQVRITHLILPPLYEVGTLMPILQMGKLTQEINSQRNLVVIMWSQGQGSDSM